MKKILLIVIMGISMNSYAQDCTPESLATLPGTWKKGQQGSIQNINPKDLTKEKAVINNLHQLINENYQPKGCQIAYSTVFGKYPGEGENWLADHYHYHMYILRYLCDKNSSDKTKYYVDASTPTTCQITANAIYSLRLYAAEIPDSDLRGYLKLEQRPVKKDGVYYMEEIEGQQYSKNKIMLYSWLITYNDTLPFIDISRKEYLLLLKKRLEKAIAQQGGDVGDYGEYKDRINEYLNKPESYLSQSAVCMWNDDERFNGFVEEGTPGSFIAIKPNLSYYRKNLELSVPQFIQIQIKIEQGNLVFNENIAGIKKALDFEKLRSMLGKSPDHFSFASKSNSNVNN
jgi:hypothetical protein